MHIEHIAVWTLQLEHLKKFYVTYLGAKAGEKYYNPDMNFESYFLSFTSGARIEVMSVPHIEGMDFDQDKKMQGYAHLAFSGGSKNMVDELT